MFVAIAGLHALSAVLRPFAARKRLKRQEAVFKMPTETLNFGTLIVTREELLKLSESGALNILIKGNQRFEDLEDMNRALKLQELLGVKGKAA
jgi:hypothetical protein